MLSSLFPDPLACLGALLRAPEALALVPSPLLATSETGIGIGVAVFIGIAILLGLASTVFWLWIVIEVAMKEPDGVGNEKIVWLLVILLVGPIGALIYFFVRRPQRISQHGR